MYNNWDEIYSQAIIGSLLLAEKSGYTEEETDEMYVRMIEHKKKKDMEKFVKKNAKANKKALRKLGVK